MLKKRSRTREWARKIGNKLSFQIKKEHQQKPIKSQLLLKSLLVDQGSTTRKKYQRLSVRWRCLTSSSL